MRAAGLIPGVKILILLRNPADRAYSQYQMSVAMGHETLSFDDAIEAEPERLRRETTRLMAGERFRTHSHVWHSYLDRGIYADQLDRWSHYFSREQMLIVKAEDLRHSRAASMQKVIDFMKLPPYDFDLSELSHSRNYAPMDSRLRARLLHYFEPHNRRLFDNLGSDFGWE